MSRKSRKNVGVIGLGIIGSRAAAGLRAAGYQVYVWNRSAKPAPNFLGSPAEVADAADIIQLFVADAQALFEVIDAMGDSLTPKHVIICSGTVGPEAVLEAAQIVENKGAQFLDAPFTGSKVAAEKRQLVYYIGGSEHTFLKAKPMLEVTSKAIVRIGEVGHAASVKVVTNMISAVTTQVLAEALSIVQKAGLQPEVLISAIEQNACRSGVIDLKLPKMIAGDYEPHFSLKHMFKDVQLGIHMANALDIEIPATTVTAGVMYGALNQGWADLDYAALFKNYSKAEPEEELPALPAVIEAEPADELPPEFKEIRALEEASAKAEKVVAEVTNAGRAAEAQPIEEKIVKGKPVEESPSSAPIPESTPTAAAAQIIEAVLRGAGDDDQEPQKEKAANPVEGVIPTADAPVESKPADSAGSPESTLEEKKEGSVPAAEAGEPTAAKPKNFVKRWFVARSGN